MIRSLLITEEIQHYQHNPKSTPPDVCLTVRRKAELTGREPTWEDATTTGENVSVMLLIILKPPSSTPIILFFHFYYLFIYFLQQKEHLRQEKALGSAACSQSRRTTGLSLCFHLHCTREWHHHCSRGRRANTNSCYWPRELLQGIFLEPRTAFLWLPCFLVQTYHGLKIPRIFYAVFPLGSHNGAVLLLSSASVREREGEQKEAGALNNPTGNHRGRGVIFQAEKWCKRKSSYLRGTFHWPLLNKGLKNVVVTPMWK